MTRRRFETQPLLIVGAALCVVAATLALAAGIQRDEAYRYLKVFQEVWSLTEASYVEPVNEGDLLDGAYRGMLSSVDAASGYVDRQDAARLEQPPGPAGPGMEILPSGGTFIVVRVDPGGPAARAGIRRGDQVWRVGERPVRDVPWPLVRRWLRGAAGDSVRLSVLDGQNFKLREATLALEPVGEKGYRLEPRGGVTVVHIENFEGIAPGRLKTDLEAFRAKGQSVLFDLRGVVSVRPEELTRLAGVLVPGGPLLELTDARGGVRELTAPATDGVALPAGQTFVLVDSSTAGVSEGLAALMQAGGARLCGRSTYGLAGVPELLELSNGDSALLTTRQARLPGGETWAGEGIEPDRQLPLTRPDPDDPASDPMLDEAVEWITAGAELEEAPELEEAA